MKSKILGLLAVALLAGPIAASGAMLSVSGNGFAQMPVGASQYEFTIRTRRSPTVGNIISTGDLIAWGDATFTFYVGYRLASASVGDTQFVPQQMLDTDPTSGRFSSSFTATIDNLLANTDYSVSIWLAHTGVAANFDLQNFRFTGISTGDVCGTPCIPYSRQDAVIRNPSYTVAPEVVPEPDTLALLGLGLAGLGLSRRRKH